MRKPVKIKDVGIGETVYEYAKDGNPYIKANFLYCIRISHSDNCAIVRDNCVQIVSKDSIFYIEVPDLKYKDIKVGEKFKIGHNTYLKVENMMRDRLSPESNPCVCMENNFLFNCEDRISLERVE